MQVDFLQSKEQMTTFLNQLSSAMDKDIMVKEAVKSLEDKQTKDSKALMNLMEEVENIKVMMQQPASTNEIKKLLKTCENEMTVKLRNGISEYNSTFISQFKRLETQVLQLMQKS